MCYYYTRSKIGIVVGIKLALLIKYIKILFLFFALFFIAFSVKALDIEEEMIEPIDKNYGIKSIKPTSDGGYVAVAAPYGVGDPLLSKYDKDGKLKWSKKYNNGAYANFIRVAVMSNGDYLTVGTTNEPQSEFYGKYKGGWNDIFVVRYDTNGNIKWQKTMVEMVKKVLYCTFLMMVSSFTAIHILMILLIIIMVQEMRL